MDSPRYFSERERKTAAAFSLPAEDEQGGIWMQMAAPNSGRQLRLICGWRQGRFCPPENPPNGVLVHSLQLPPALHGALVRVQAWEEAIC